MIAVEKTLKWMLLGTTLIFIPQFFDSVNLPKLLWLLASTSILVYFGLKNKIQQDLKTTIIIFLIPASLLISALINNSDWYYNFFGYYQRNSGILLYTSLAIAVYIISGLNIKSENFLKILFLPFILMLLYILLQAFNLDPMPWGNPYNRIIGTLGNPNFSSAFMGMMIPIVLSQRIKINNNLRALLWVGIFTLIFLTNSQQGRIVAILSTFVYLSIVYWNKKRKFILAGLGIISLFTLTSILTIIGFLKIETLKNFILLSGSGSSRIAYWEAALRMFKDRPLFGFGPDGFGRYFGFYRTPQDVLRDGANSIADHAHGIVFEFLADGGIVLMTSWIIFNLFVAKKIFSVINSDKLSSSEIRNFAILASIWTGYLVQSLISIEHVALATIGYLIAGVIISNSNFALVQKNRGESQKKINLGGKLSSRIAAGSATITIVMVVYLSSIDIKFANLTEAIPPNANSMLNLSNITSNKSMDNLMARFLQKSGEFEIAQKLALKATSLDEMDGKSWYVAGISSRNLNNFAQAEEYFKKSHEVDPNNTFYLMGLAFTQIDNKNAVAAEQTLNLIQKLNPLLPELQGVLLELEALKKN